MKLIDFVFLIFLLLVPESSAIFHVLHCSYYLHLS